MAYVGFTLFLLATLALRYSYVEAAADPAFQREYDSKVCNSEPTCNLTTNPNLLSDKLTLPWRDCMCDFECSEYDDCCKDSQYFKTPQLYNPSKTYFCPSDAKVYMVVSCLPGYTDERVKANCAQAFKPLKENNFALILPVTNTNKRITYANAYCALCNDDEDFVPWLYASGCGEPPPGYFEKKGATVRKESSNTHVSKNVSASSTAVSPSATSTSTSKPNNNLMNVNIHLNPTAILGNRGSKAGFNKEIHVPGFFGSKLTDKNIGSETGFFGVKSSGRSRRQASNMPTGGINFYPYARKINELMKVVKYDPSVKEFVAHFEGKKLVCKIGIKMPDTLNKHVRKCFPNLISECPNNPEANKRCQSYMKLVHDIAKDRSYRNLDCALCNGVDPNVVKLTGCYPSKRTGASSLFSSDGKGNANNEVCNDPKLAAKLC